MWYGLQIKWETSVHTHIHTFIKTVELICPMGAESSTHLMPSLRGAWAASCQWVWSRCTWSGKGHPPGLLQPSESGPADWCSTSLPPSWSGQTCWPVEGRIQKLECCSSSLLFVCVCGCVFAGVCVCVCLRVQAALQWIPIVFVSLIHY